MKRIVQFAYKDSIPPDPKAPVLDCRILLNPFRHNETDEQIMRRFDTEVRPTLAFEKLVQRGLAALKDGDELQVGCFGGKHRSVAVAKEIARRHEDRVEVRFRDGTVATYVP